MRVIYMGRKPIACEGLRFLIEKGINVVVVVAPPKGQYVYGENSLVDTAEYYGIPIASDEELYGYPEKQRVKEYEFDLTDIDLVISFLFWKRIKKPLIDLPKIGCINIHPAPLPDFRGFAPYSFAIYENLPYWGATAHFVDESFDTGSIIKTLEFDINPTEETAFSLQQKGHKFALQLFKEVITEALEKGTLMGTPQSQGRYMSKDDFERLRQIQSSDTAEEIEKKIRAFWCPPCPGATVEINGTEYTLINEKILREISNAGHI